MRAIGLRPFLVSLTLHGSALAAVIVAAPPGLLGRNVDGGTGWAAPVTWAGLGIQPSAPQPIEAVAEPPPLPAEPTPQVEVTPAAQPTDLPLVAMAGEASAPAHAGGGPVAGEGESLGSTGEIPAPVWNPRPSYPAKARSEKLEGAAVVALKVGPDGNVLEASLVSSSGHEILDQEALATVRRWRFAPGSGVTELTQKIVFQLR